VTIRHHFHNGRVYCRKVIALPRISPIPIRPSGHPTTALIVTAFRWARGNAGTTAESAAQEQQAVSECRWIHTEILCNGNGRVGKSEGIADGDRRKRWPKETVCGSLSMEEEEWESCGSKEFSAGERRSRGVAQGKQKGMGSIRASLLPWHGQFESILSINVRPLESFPFRFSCPLPPAAEEP
jgi:hypothetical protein